MFNQIYVNGCSHTAGGGLHEAMEWYKSKGIIYNNPRELAYPKIIGTHFNLLVTDESLHGTGAIKLIKDVHMYIERVGLEESIKTLFILQFNESIFRYHAWSNTIGDYFNAYIFYDEKNTYNANILDNWINPSKFNNNDLQKTSEYFTKNISEFYNPIQYDVEIKRRLIDFISFMEFHELNFIFTCETLNIEHLGERLCKNQFMPNNKQSIYSYAKHKKIRLKDFTNVNDNHPSIEAHRDYANLLIRHIKQKYF